MENVTKNMPFYDVMEWLLDDENIAELLNYSESSQFGPFFPVAEQPEGAFPQVRYNVSTTNGFPEWWHRIDTVTMNVFVENLDDLNELLNEFYDLCSEGADSARSLEIWLDGREDFEQEFVYHSLEVPMMGDLKPPGEEGASYSRPIVLVIRYSPLKGRNIKS